MLCSQDQVLCKLAKLLSEQGVFWGLGGETMLRLRRVLEDSAQICIMIGTQEIETVDALFSSIGTAYQRELSPHYASRFFRHYAIEGQDVTVVSGLALHHQGFFFTYPLTPADIVSTHKLGGVSIPMIACEDVYVLYQMMPGYEHLVQQMERHFASCGLERPERFAQLRRHALPPAVIASILRWTAMELHA